MVVSQQTALLLMENVNVRMHFVGTNVKRSHAMQMVLLVNASKGIKAANVRTPSVVKDVIRRHVVKMLSIDALSMVGTTCSKCYTFHYLIM